MNAVTNTSAPVRATAAPWTNAPDSSATRVAEWPTYFGFNWTKPTVRMWLTSSSKRQVTATAVIETSASSTGESELGRRLRAIRAQIVASGERLLDWDELEQELAERRGER